ncbi:Olfactory receptor 15 [Heterocephalus glaber]|uniref:Olfactory receptor n=1 Tax=Heterocephalus glaber TaxID=10181 RepID=G5BRI2_HETGA|nr:olfactory receptor 2G3-like [Heterocephalus glaber]EHB11893.1 Olfactory receptor 15 [Heterocephalus glaber]
MERGNMSFPNTFVLLGFSEFPWLEKPLFAVVLFSYLLTLVGNSTIILLSLVDPRLQTPMYFFLDNLSLLDLCITCTIVPQLLANLWGPEKTIPSRGCITQLYVYTWVGTTECAVLAVMAIDRYVAICRPLQYTLIMHPSVCVQMATASWSSGLTSSLLQATLTLQLPLCGHHTLDHLFCEVPVLIKLACGETSANELAMVVGNIPFAMVAPLLVVISYTFIARAVLKLPSAEGRHKALSTCSSHLLVVTMYFGPGIYMYLQPPAKSSQAKFLSFFYCVITPMLNPLIYTLRNKDVQTAWKRILQSQGRVKFWKPRRSLPVS